ncbi:hypothetical protein ACFQGT_09785 [Natrialbaceae archaeon GCM10025810]|uniref:hypothetical protein n=1 Tax=Halovalidus salilacus TaxID=3075124 RepID=UPI0036244266
MSYDSSLAEGGSIVYEPIMSRSKKVRFYIPTTKDGAEDVVDEVVIRLSNLFGGATTLPAKGAYVMNDGELVREEVTLVESFHTDMKTADLTQVALQIKDALNEEAVAFEVEQIESAFV